MLQKSSSYSTSGSYVFVSYSHRDAKRVKKEISYLEQAGIPVWYDRAIRPGHRWRVELARAIENCSTFLFFASNSAVRSGNCEQELAYAAEHNRPLLQIQLEETELPTEFKFALATHQAIYAWQMPTGSYRTQMVETLGSKLDGVLTPTLENSAQRVQERPSRRYLLPGVLVAATLVLMVFLLNDWSVKRTPTRTATLPYEASDQSIAVMRFITIGENTSVGDGLSEQLLHLLMSLKEVSVPSRTSAWVASNENLEPREVAQRLGVRYVLEGSVQQVGERLRVTAQLIDGFTGLHVWSDSYDKQLSAGSFFDIQDSIAAQLLSHLKITLSRSTVTALANHPTSNYKALDAYLKGRVLRRGPNTDQNIRAAQLAFQQALNLDKNFADAHAALCESYLAGYTVQRDDESFSAAKRHCLAAERLDNNQSMVLIALGTLYRHEGRLQDAEVKVDKALSLEPRNTAALEEQGRLLRAMGRYREAETTFEKAIRIEPGNWSVYKSMGNFLVRTGRYPEAVSLYRQSLRLDPGNPVSENNLATALHYSGQFDAAAELWSKIAATSPSFLVYLNLANARFYEGAFETAVQVYGKAIERSATDFRGFGGRAASLEYARGTEAALPDYRQAAERAQLALERNPHDAQTLSRLSFYQAKLDRDDLARAALKRLAALPALDPNSMFMESLAHITLEDKEAARSALDSAISAGFPLALVQADPLVTQIFDRRELGLRYRPGNRDQATSGD